MSLQNRYEDAYLVAGTVNGAGQAIKVVGFVAAAVAAIGGFIVAGKVSEPRGIGAIIGAVMLGALIALPFYALGVLVSTQGQILKAILDTAVNTSSLLTRDEARRILLQSTAADPTSLSPTARDSSKPDGRCPECDTAFWYADYRKGAPQILCGSCRAELPQPG
jgi:hypothetical protein